MSISVFFPGVVVFALWFPNLNIMRVKVFGCVLALVVNAVHYSSPKNMLGVTDDLCSVMTLPYVRTRLFYHHELDNAKFTVSFFEPTPP